MTNSKLLENLKNDLANVNAPKQAHIQIERIISAYEQQVQKEVPENARKESKK
jgi:hypothetical protein